MSYSSIDLGRKLYDIQNTFAKTDRATIRTSVSTLSQDDRKMLSLAIKILQPEQSFYREAVTRLLENVDQLDRIVNEATKQTSWKITQSCWNLVEWAQSSVNAIDDDYVTVEDLMREVNVLIRLQPPSLKIPDFDAIRTGFESIKNHLLLIAPVIKERGELNQYVFHIMETIAKINSGLKKIPDFLQESVNLVAEDCRNFVEASKKTISDEEFREINVLPLLERLSGCIKIVRDNRGLLIDNERAKKFIRRKMPKRLKELESHLVFLEDFVINAAKAKKDSFIMKSCDAISSELVELRKNIPDRLLFDQCDQFMEKCIVSRETNLDGFCSVLLRNIELVSNQVDEKKSAIILEPFNAEIDELKRMVALKAVADSSIYRDSIEKLKIKIDRLESENLDSEQSSSLKRELEGKKRKLAFLKRSIDIDENFVHINLVRKTFYQALLESELQPLLDSQGLWAAISANFEVLADF